MPARTLDFGDNMTEASSKRLISKSDRIGCTLLLTFDGNDLTDFIDLNYSYSRLIQHDH
jgi:hypothetical protein